MLIYRAANKENARVCRKLAVTKDQWVIIIAPRSCTLPLDLLGVQAACHSIKCGNEENQNTK